MTAGDFTVKPGCVSFKDEFDDPMDIERLGEVIQIDTKGTQYINLDRDRARVLSRILAFYAEDGDLGRAQQAIDGDVPGDRLAAQADRIDELEERLGATRNRIEVLCESFKHHRDRIEAIESRLQPQSAPEPAKTPQQIADEMTAKFPVGTKVSYLIYPNGGKRWDDGTVVSSFFVADESSLVVAIMGGDGVPYFAHKLEPR